MLGDPLQCSCLENPGDGRAWWAAVYGVTQSRTRLSDFTFTFHFHALEKEMATHSNILAWRIPGTGEPGGLPAMGSHRVIKWSDLAAAAAAASAYLRLLIFLPPILILACASSYPLFLMLYSAYKLNKHGDNIQPWCTPFPIWNQYVVPCPVPSVTSWLSYRFPKCEFLNCWVHRYLHLLCLHLGLIPWSSKKQEFQKNIYFCFIDYTKAFDCVHHNKL